MKSWLLNQKTELLNWVFNEKKTKKKIKPLSHIVTLSVKTACGVIISQADKVKDPSQAEKKINKIKSLSSSKWDIYETNTW